ncbi:hypothetical protein ACM66B_004409 [Microbotryomycetes sp. NB124-2]
MASGAVLTSSPAPHKMTLRSGSSSKPTYTLNSPVLNRPDLNRSTTNSPWSRFLSPSLFTTSGCRSTSNKQSKPDHDDTRVKVEQDTTGLYTLENEANPFDQQFSFSKPSSEAGEICHVEFGHDHEQSVEIINTISMDEIEPDRAVDAENGTRKARAVTRRRPASTTSSSRSSSSSVDALSLFSGSTSGTDLTNIDLANSAPKRVATAVPDVSSSSMNQNTSFEQLHQRLAAAATEANSRAYYQPAPNPISLHANGLADSSSSILTVTSIAASSSERSQSLNGGGGGGLFSTLQHGGLVDMRPSTTALSDIQVGPVDALGATAPRTSGRKRKVRPLFDDADLPESVLEDGSDKEQDHEVVEADVVVAEYSSPRRVAKKLKSDAFASAGAAAFASSAGKVTSGRFTGGFSASEAGDSVDGEGGGAAGDDTVAPVKKEGKAAALERNRLAAIRSRQKKKERVDGLQQAVTTLTASNAQMQTQALQLYDEVQQLRQMLSAIHPAEECECKHVQGYLARERKGQGIPLIEQMAGEVLSRAFVPGVTDEVTVKASSRDGDQVERWREQVRREKEDMERKGKKTKVVDEQHAIPIKKSSKR